MKQKVKSEISDSAAKTLKLQTKFVIIKMPVRQVIHSYLSSFLYPASTGSYFAKTRQRKEKNKKYLKERCEEEPGSFSCLFFCRIRSRFVIKKSKNRKKQGKDLNNKKQHGIVNNDYYI
jgi:hypothetical protein